MSPGRCGEAGCSLSHSETISQFPTVLGQQAFTEGLHFIRQPTGQSRTCHANRTLLSPAGATALSLSLSPLCHRQSPSRFQLLQLSPQNGFSCSSPKQAETIGPNPKPRSAGHSTLSWLLSPSASLQLPFHFSTESPVPAGFAIHSPAPSSAPVPAESASHRELLSLGTISSSQGYMPL